MTAAMPAAAKSTTRSTTNSSTKSNAKRAIKTSPSRLIDGRIKELGDWRGETLSRVRALIKQVIPDVVEEWKWRGVPVWYHDGMLCTGETYRAVVKVTFAKGAALADPRRLFNSSLEGNTRRAIDFREGEKLDEKALKALLRAAADLNSRASGPAKRGATRPAGSKRRQAGSKPSSGGRLIRGDRAH